jgi:hypothetical protein
MKNILLIILLVSMSQLLVAQDIYGSWVTDQYRNDFPGNYLDMITIIPVSEGLAIIQHSFYRSPEWNYIVQASILDGMVKYTSPLFNRTVSIELLRSGRIQWYLDIDQEMISIYERPNFDYYNFLAEVDEFIENAQYLDWP